MLRFAGRGSATLSCLALLGAGIGLLSACGSAAGTVSSPAAPTGATAGRILFIGGIPDQAPATLARAFEGFARQLGAKTGVEVRYAPAQDYAAIVTAFQRGEVHLVWFGGLTGVQARARVPGARAVAQRPIDAEFHSVFVAGRDRPAAGLADLRGVTFTFGSESSTSGHLMPRHFLLEAGIDPDRDFKGKPNFSGSHDKTWKLVETGAFQAGALNEAVWDKAVKDGKVDLSQIREVSRTPAYFDYNWTVHPEIDAVFGPGTTDKLTGALLAMRPVDGPEAREALELFATDRFVPTTDANYAAIQQVAERLGILK